MIPARISAIPLVISAVARIVSLVIVRAIVVLQHSMMMVTLRRSAFSMVQNDGHCPHRLHRAALRIAVLMVLVGRSRSSILSPQT